MPSQDYNSYISININQPASSSSVKEESKKVRPASSKLKNARKHDSDDDENFEEPPDQRALPHFLQNLPGVTATDSMGYRIEALRVYLEQQLGDVPFIAAYKHLVVSSNP